MPEYLSPGVYIEEVDRGPKPIEGVGTAMAAFVGFTEKAELEREIDGETVVQGLFNRPQLITNWSQYQESFGGFVEGAYLPHAVYGYFNNGGNRCYVVSVKTFGRAEGRVIGSDGKEHLKIRARQAGLDGLRLRARIEFPGNGATPPPEMEAEEGDGGQGKSSGRRSTRSSGKGGDGEPKPFTVIIERQSRHTSAWLEQEKHEAVTIVEEPNNKGKLEFVVKYKNDRKSKLIEFVMPEKVVKAANLWPRAQEINFNMEHKIDPPTASEFQGDVEQRTGMEGVAALDEVTMLCIPDLMSVPPGESVDRDMIKSAQTAMLAHCANLGDRVAILDAPPDMRPKEVKDWRMDIAGYDSSYAALYYPWVEVEDPVLNHKIKIPPCGHIAGIWARNDNTRGVHKAPANEVAQGVVGLAYDVTKGEQDELNPNGVNCIRAFPGRGIRVWGARTLASDPAWRYINVRRLFNFVEKSIERGTQWVVFEPNDHKLWARVRRDVSAFLRTVWRDGALFGLTPDEAFYVKCDEELNPRESRDLGRLIIEIGLCPVKPAEFVIFRISQWAGPNAET